MENLSNLIKETMINHIHSKQLSYRGDEIIGLEEIAFNWIKTPIYQSFNQIGNESIYYSDGEMDRTIFADFHCRIKFGVNNNDSRISNGKGSFNGVYNLEKQYFEPTSIYLSFEK